MTNKTEKRNLGEGNYGKNNGSEVLFCRESKENPMRNKQTKCKRAEREKLETAF
jgi:hypothetical protein